MRYAIGIDIGGTKINGVLINDKGIILKKIIHPTEANKHKEAIIQNILHLAFKLKIKDVCGIGISASGVTDKDGKFVFNPNVKKLEGVNLSKMLKDKFHCIVAHENDANCFALAEHHLGAGKGTTNMIGVIIGTGIGAGIIINGSIYKGNGAAGEFGHSIIMPDGPLCKCGLRGDIESLCSGPAIIKRYYHFGGKLKDAKPTLIGGLNESAAIKTMEETNKYLGIGLSHIANAFDPDMIVLGGGVSKIPFYKEINKEIRKYSNKASKATVQRSKLGDDSCAIGASLILLK